MHHPLVSVIMPTYNSARFIAEAIDSVLAQTYESWELLIVDDGSTDDTLAIVRDFAARDARIRLIGAENTVNQGPAVTRNRAIEAASGRFIAFLDSDDIWDPAKLAVQIPFMLAEDVPLSFGLYRKVNENGTVLKTVDRLPREITYNDLLQNQVIGCLTAAYDTQICGKVYMPLIRKRQDYALWLSLLRPSGRVARCVPHILGSYRVRKDSVSANKWVAVGYTWRVYRDIEKLSLLKSCRAFACMIVRRIVRG